MEAVVTSRNYNDLDITDVTSGQIFPTSGVMSPREVLKFEKAFDRILPSVNNNTRNIITACFDIHVMQRLYSIASAMV